MKITFLVNEVGELTADMTSTLLAQRAAASGHEVWVCGVADLAILEGCVLANCRRAPPGDLEEAWIQALRGGPEQSCVVTESQLLWIRTNPARDAARAAIHRMALGVAELVQRSGTTVVNDPVGLMRASSKLYLSGLPTEFRPTTLVSSDRARLLAFVRERADAVLKPLEGTHGQGVFRTGRADPNLTSLVDASLRDGPVIAQALAPGAELGDLRLLLVQGEMLTVGGQVAAVQRVPGAGEFRSNVHAGGTPTPGVITPRITQVVEQLGPILRRDGIFFAGLDLIGGQVLEINVFSPGGLGDASAFEGVDFALAVVEAACRLAA